MCNTLCSCLSHSGFNVWQRLLLIKLVLGYQRSLTYRILLRYDPHFVLKQHNNQIRKFNSKLNFYKLIPYLVDRCICPALCRSRQTLEKNVLSWALAGTGSVLFTRQVAVQPTCRYTAHALFLFLLSTL